MDDWDTGPTNTDFESIPRHDQAIIDAAVNGDVAAVRQWLDDGGDADARIKVGPYIPGRDNYVFGGDDEGLLHYILRFHPNNFDDEVKRGRCDVVRLLMLRPRLRGIFALRTLVLRGRASPTTETPAAFARLIVRGTSRPRTRAAAKTLPSPGLPDALAHHVCKFWLGEPPRRRTE